MVSTDDVAVVTDDEVEAKVLDYLYEHLVTGAYVVNLHEAAELPAGWGGNKRLLGILAKLRAEGKVVTWANIWFKLTPKAWLSMTASKQLSSTISTG